jgi:TonB family protein
MSLIFLVLLFLQPAEFRQTDATLEETLNRKYSGTLYWVRDFRAGFRLRYAADGTYRSGGSSGVFGADGSLQVESVRVRPTLIEVRGRRAFLRFDAKTNRLEPVVTDDEIRLEFIRESGIAIERGIDAVLLTREQVSSVLPPYWERFVLGKGGRPQIVDPQTGAAIPSAEPGMTPRILKRAAPRYPEEARKRGFGGVAVLRVAVDERGKGTVVDIATPLGFGLDQAAINVIDQWEFEPAQRDGKPVKVYLRVRFDFGTTNP